MKVLLSAVVCWLVVSHSTFAKDDSPVRDVVFATVDSHELRLNLFLPEGVVNPPLVVFIHGGGWRNGSYKNCRTTWLTEAGFAVASIGYRLTDKAIFPAQIHDCKAAVRWLRAHADEYGYDTRKIGVAGTSAGGHLALLLGLTNGTAQLEGTVGENTDQSSQVHAVVDYFGPTDFLLLSRNQPVKTEKEGSPVRLLLGGPASKNIDVAKLASPVSHVSKDDPPLLIIHGSKDATVLLDQSQRIVEEYEKAGLDVTLEIVSGAGHGGPAHFTTEFQKKVADFLKRHLASD